MQQEGAEVIPRKPRRKTRSKRSKKSKGKTNEGDPIPKESGEELRPHKASTTAVPQLENPEQQLKTPSSSETDSGGSVLVEKVNEPLEAALKAVGSRITSFTELPKKLQEYPNPRAEKVGLAVHQQMIRDTQTMLEGPSPAYRKRSTLVKPRLDTIVEATSSVEKGSEIVSLPPFDDVPLDDKLVSNKPSRGYTTANFGDEIPEFKEALANEMWEAVHQHVDEQGSSIHTPPFSVVDFTGKRAAIEDHHSLRDGSQTEWSANSLHRFKARMSTWGKSKNFSETITQAPLGENKEFVSLQTLMSTPVPCMLPLEDLLRAKPEIWEEVAKRMGFTRTRMNHKTLETQKTPKETKPPILVPLNKVGKYCEDDEGNMTLPVQIENVKSIAILDSGAGVSIATRTIWEKWGKPAIRSTRMNLQLADGNLENPMGLLERVIVKSCGLEYEHTFAIVDFGKNTNYEVILGQPFMRQFRMIQDWGYNYLYLRHKSVVTRVNLRSHRYRDVTKSPVEEFDSGSSDETESTLSVDKAGLWICGTSCKDLKPEDVVIDRSVTDEAYVPLPFPEHLIDPQEWIHVFATLSTCALPKQTQFCDPDGYDIIPIRMISIVKGKSKENKGKYHKEQISQLETDTVSVRELSNQDYGSADEGDNDGCLDMSEDLDSEGDDIVPESEIEKVRLLLKEREVLLDIPYDKPKQKFCKSHRKFRKQALKEK